MVTNYIYPNIYFEMVSNDWNEIEQNDETNRSI